jgi:hypothetical protein
VALCFVHGNEMWASLNERTSRLSEERGYSEKKNVPFINQEYAH